MQVNDPRVYVTQLAEALAPGETLRCACPKCSSKENTLNITRKDSGYVWNCFRASCDFSGMSFSSSNVPANDSTTTVKETVYPKYDGIFRAVPDEVWSTKLACLKDHKNAVFKEGIRFADREQRIYIPLFDRFKSCIGYQLKAVFAYQRYKVLSTRTTEGPLYHIPLMGDITTPLVIVEDVFSAIKVSLAGYCGFAILGSSITKKQAVIIRELSRNQEVRLMLDGDAQDKAAELCQKFIPYLQLRHIPLDIDKDPKDCSLQTLKNMLQ